MRVKSGSWLIFSIAVLCSGVMLRTVRGQPSVSGSGNGIIFAEAVDRAYGQDQELINGIQYYNRYMRSGGHPYFMDGQFHEGMVTVNGSVFGEVYLKYDVYSQHVELGYEAPTGGTNQLVMVTAHLDSFRIGDFRFERLDLDGEKRIYQVIRTTGLAMYVQWTKKLYPASNDPRHTSSFTQPHCNYLLERDGKVYRFGNRREFLSLFPGVPRKEIRMLLRKYRVSFRNANPASFPGLLDELAETLQFGPTV
jgi:hypothetical protein